MKSVPFAVLVVLLVPLLLSHGPGHAAAQDAPGTVDQEGLVSELPAEEVGERASDLLARLNSSVDATIRHRGKLATASSEDRLVLRILISSLQVAALGDLHELADVLHEQEQKGPQRELKDQVERAFGRVTPLLWRRIAHLRGEIDEIRALRSSTPVEERTALEDRVTKPTRRLDDLYAISVTHVEKMEELGLDTSQEKATISESLMGRAEELSGRMELAQERIKDLKVRQKETPDDANVPVLLVAAQKDLDNNVGSMEVVLDLMQTLELPGVTYRAQLVTVTSDISSGLLDARVAVSLVGQATSRVTDWIAENGLGLVAKLLLIAVILGVSRFVARLVSRAVGRSLDASKLDISHLLHRMIVSTTSNLVMLFGLLVALSQLGISLGPLLGGLGVAGFIIGFALQDSLSNFASGLMILIYRPYDVGDVVDFGGVRGKVDRMSLVSTTILTFDNERLVVPNKKIWGDVIKNVTAQDVRRVDLRFGLSYSDDISRAETVLSDILQGHDKVLDEPESVVRLHALGDSSVDFVVRPWVKTEDYWDVYWDVTRAVKTRFDEEGISIPFPQQDVHIYEEQQLKEQGA
jgi:small conductance mechanosensitive channel